MTRFRIAPLVAAVSMVFMWSAAGADETGPVTIAQTTTQTTTPPAAITPAVLPETGLGAWPIAPSARPFDRALTGDDLIPSVQIPAGETAAPQLRPTLDLTSTPTSLWDRIRQGFGLTDITTPLVQQQIDWFANRPDFIKRTMERSSRYLYHIVEEVQKRGMPTEIA